jgi:hypothetical protein
VSPADQAAGEGEEAFVDVVAAVGADQQSTVVVQPSEGAFNDPPLPAEPRTMAGPSAADDRLDTAFPEQSSVLVVVVAPVGEELAGASSRSADAAAHSRHAVDEVEQLGDVVAVAARQRPRERQPTAVYKQVVFAATAAAIDGARPCLGAPFFA